MNFEEAYKELFQGKKIRRKSWDKFHHIKYFPKTSENDESVHTYNYQVNNFFGDASVLISNGWIVVGGNGKELTFIEALEELKRKKEITKKEWLKKGINKYIFIDANHFAVCSAVEANFMPSYKCLISNDWEVME